MTIPTGGNLLSALITGVLLGGVFAITALGLSLVFGVMRLVNIVHGELIVLGAYLALYLTRHAGIDPLLSMLIVAPLLFLFALPLYRVLLEPLMAKGPEPALLTTFALSVIGQNLFILIWSGDTQSLRASYATASLSLGTVRIPAMYLISFAIALVLCGGVHLMLQRTGLGREIRASSEDSATAAGLGEGPPARGNPARRHRERGCLVLRRRLPRPDRFRRVPYCLVPASAGPVRAGSTVMTRRRILIAGLILAAIIAAVIVPRYSGQYGLLVAFEIVQLAALSQAWSLLAGYGGIVSLAVAAFVGVGSYGTAEVAFQEGWGVVPSVLAGGLVAVVFALVVSVPMLRFRGLYFTIGSLVLAEALGIFMSNFSGFGGNAGITLPGTAPSLQTIYLYSLVIAVAATAIVALLVRSRLGLGLKAIRDDQDVAERVGVRTFRAKLTAFVISAFVMGIVGGLQAQWTGYIEPTGSFALDWTVNTVNAAIIGGGGTIVGPLAGSAISVEISQRLANYPTIHLIILGVLLIVVIRLTPSGLWGAVLQLAKTVQRRYGPKWGGPRAVASSAVSSLAVPATAAAEARARPAGAGLTAARTLDARSPGAAR